MISFYFFRSQFLSPMPQKGGSGGDTDPSWSGARSRSPKAAELGSAAFVAGALCGGSDCSGLHGAWSAGSAAALGLSARVSDWWPPHAPFLALSGSSQLIFCPVLQVRAGCSISRRRYSLPLQLARQGLWKEEGHPHSSHGGG